MKATLKSSKIKLGKAETKLANLVKKHDDLVALESDIEEIKTDKELENLSTKKEDTKLYNILNKCYENTEAQAEVKKVIKNLKATIKRK